MTQQVSRRNHITWIAAAFPKEFLRELYLYVCDNLQEGQKLNLGQPVIVTVEYNRMNDLLREYLSKLGAYEGDTIILPGVEIEIDA